MAANPTSRKLYPLFMQEIKERLQQIDLLLTALKHNHKSPTAIYQAELAFLHLRLVCELIALSALSAHYSNKIPKDLLKTWHADEIFVQLEKINPTCFPLPVKSLKRPGNELSLTPRANRKMSRLDLRDIYGQCGNALHVGALKHALTGRRRTYDLNQLTRWHRKIERLLEEHFILFLQDRRGVYISMSPDDTDRVLVAHVEYDTRSGSP